MTQKGTRDIHRLIFLVVSITALTVIALSAPVAAEATGTLEATIKNEAG